MYIIKKGLRFLPVAIGICLAATRAAGAAEANAQEPDAAKKMSIEDARRLVGSIYPEGDTHHPQQVDHDPNPFAPQFYAFETLWANPIGSPHIGSYEVNPWTADVWDDDAGCKLLRTPSLKKVQKEIRKQLNLSNEELAKARLLRPACYAGS